jgi:hypothetical protein
MTFHVAGALTARFAGFPVDQAREKSAITGPGQWRPGMYHS